MGFRLRSNGTVNSPKLLVTAYSSRRLNPNRKLAVKKALSAKLGINDALTEFYSFARKDRILRHTIKDLYGMHDTQSSSLFAATILATCLQMAPLKRSNQMMNCILEKYGEIAEFNNTIIRTWPSPASIARLNIMHFSKVCNLGFRARYIVQTAKILAGNTFPSLDELSQLPSEVAKARLLELPGIGDYSADIINPRGGFPIDVWSVEVFGMLFFGKISKNARIMIEKVKQEGIRRWGKWSWMAFFYVANDLQNLSTHLHMKIRLT
jgi:3-methyladenine DNA glycosylase/8-oxoguanine DNA glycosylase